MDEQNRDHFYEGPPLETPEDWHDGAVVGEPDAQQRPDHPPAQAAPSINRDPSLSRAVDREAEGLDAQAAGYDRAIEGPSPGALEPSVDEQQADTPEMPAGE